MNVKSTLCVVLLLCIVVFSSCDLIIPMEGEGYNFGNLLVSVVFDFTNSGHWHRIDEVEVYDNGAVAITRIEGETIPSSARYLSDEEFRYLKSLFVDFKELEDTYLREEYIDSRRYTITYLGDRLEKTVTCDNSVYDYGYDNQNGYKILLPIVRALNDIRVSLLGEDKYAGKLKFSLRPEKTVFNLDEDIVLLFQVQNFSRQDITLPFANQQQLGYTVYYEGKLIGRFPDFFLPAGSSWRIPAGSVREQRVSWQQTIFYDTYEFSGKKVKSGVYTLVQYLLDGNSPYRATEITITENGTSPLQARAIRSILRPGLVIYELNNRISDEYVFDFNINKPIGFRIISADNGSVVRADSTETAGSARIAIKPFGDYIYPIEWNGRDSSGNLLKNGRYILEMWMIGQDPKYRATSEFWIYNI